MSDLFQQLHANPLSGWLARAIGLPNPVSLAREVGGYVPLPLAKKTAVLVGVKISSSYYELQSALRDAGAVVHEGVPPRDLQVDVLVVDVTQCRTPEETDFLYQALQPQVRRLAVNARVLIVAAQVAGQSCPLAAAVARGMEGFTRSLAKEVGKRGVTANLVYLAPDAQDRLDGAVRFFCSKQAAYVTGQAVHVSANILRPTSVPDSNVLSGKVALVTGSARGIGLATAKRLAQEGALVVCLDIPAVTEELEARTAEIGATALPLDIAAADAPRRLADFLTSRFGGVDIVVHNAGITRDRTLRNMSETLWNQVINVNLAAIVAADKVLIEEGILREEGRVVCLSSISGISGNFGQTNYALTKAALIGYVGAQAHRLAPRGISINAVAPGFIETPMTDAMPFTTREIGRRLNSLKQGGQPRDVAELIAFLCSPSGFGITGNTLRVCGQQLIGA